MKEMTFIILFFILLWISNFRDIIIINYLKIIRDFRVNKLGIRYDRENKNFSFNILIIL